MNEQFSEKPIDFLAPRAYPVEPSAPPPLARPSRSRFPQYLLAAFFLIAGVGVLTWIKMNSAATGGIGSTQVDPGPVLKGAAVLRFAFDKAKWDEEDDDYALEIEKGHDGH